MAQLRMSGTSLVVELSTAEKFLALRRHVEVPLSAVRDVEVVDDVIHQLHALRPGRLKLLGSWVPGRIAVGTFLAGTNRPTFAAVRRDPPRGLRISLDGARFGELLIGSRDPEADRQRILAAR
jgi:hypothetical protein